MKRRHFLLLLVFICLVILFRFYNLPQTTRFTRDESSNLRDMKRIWVTRDITLIGPIDANMTIIYPSLTFYMLMPFAVLGKFEPQSPAYGTAFFGLLIVFLILFLTKKLNKKLLPFVAALSVVWFPLIESSRWAWNPHLVAFTSIIAILLYFRKDKISFIVSGVCFGLSFHLHYLTFFSFAAFILLVGLKSLRQKKFLVPILIFLGFFLMIVPFIYFDWKNPPGLFFNHFWKNNLIRSHGAPDMLNFIRSFSVNIYQSLFYLSQNMLLAIFLGFILVWLTIKDLIHKSQSLLFLIPVVPQIAIISFLPTFENRYFLLGLSFFITWLIYPRGKKEGSLVKFAVLIMILGSLGQLKNQLTKPIREPAAGTVSLVSNYIRDKVNKDDRKNVNVAVLASPDADPLGVVYRHTLQVKGINLLLENQFDITDNLFVVSTSDEDKVRKDPANVMGGFRKGPLADTYKLANSEWRVYLFNRY